MGILLDFETEKKRIIDAAVNTVADEMEDAVEMFTFSRLPKRDRIALVLAGILGGEAEQWLSQADQISFYADKDFTVPYKKPVPAPEIL